MDIADLLRKGEGKTVEFKRDISSKTNIVRTAIAFANTAGGVIVIGVNDDKSILGVEHPFDIEEKLSNIISDSVAPQNVLNTCYDEEPFLAHNTEGLDTQLISEYISEMGKKLNRSTLRNLRLEVTAGTGNKTVPTNGAYILFGKDRLTHFPDAKIQAALFGGKDKSDMLDSADFTDPLIASIEHAMAFIKRNIGRASSFDSLRRKDSYRYPTSAIREALINSVVHCNYALRGTPISIGLFSDRIEITNPGTLPYGLTIDDLYKGVSKLRNRAIGRFFRELNLIEQWGSGIGRIIAACKNAGLSEPKFEEIGTQFRVTLFGTPEKAIQLSQDEKSIVDALKKRQKLSTKEVAKIINKTERTARSKMIVLMERGLVAEIGSGPKDPRKKYVLMR